MHKMQTCTSSKSTIHTFGRAVGRVQGGQTSCRRHDYINDSYFFFFHSKNQQGILRSQRSHHSNCMNNDNNFLHLSNNHYLLAAANQQQLSWGQNKGRRIITIQKRWDRTLAIINPHSKDNMYIDKDDDTNGKKKHNRRKNTSQNRMKKKTSGYKFMDRARLRLTGGSGGKGCISHQTLSPSYKKRPDGGHGGNGGFVVFVADPNEQSLNFQTHHFKGEDGNNGSSNQMNGRNGKDTIVRVPCGVVVRRVLGYNEIWDEEKERVVVIKPGDLAGVDREEKYGQYVFDEGDDDDEISDNASTSLESSEINETAGNPKKKKHYAPKDYDEIVDQGIRSKGDNMYHWTVPASQNNDDDDDEGDDPLDSLISNTGEMSMMTMAEMEEREKIPIADLDKPGSYVIVAAGGRGGIGNSIYAKRQFSPNHVSDAAERSSPYPGEVAHVELELKLIADIGLVGFPNAGKSSLLAAMSKAKPAIAPYPFTTLHPLVGCIEYRDGFRALVADVPGLIDGAAAGRGRGHDFLRHLERTKALLYMVDAAGTDGRDPVNDLNVLINEIASYGDGDMMSRSSLIVANKLDLIPDVTAHNDILLSLGVAAEEAGVNVNGDVLGISAGVTGEGLSLLSRSMRNVIEIEEANRIIGNEALV